MRCVADTSWLIAHVNAQDRFHDEARAEAAKAELVHVPTAIWVEFQNVLQYRFGGHTSAVRAADEIRRAQNVQIGTELDDDAVRQMWRKHGALTYSDAAAIVEAQRRGLHLCTFDPRQEEAFDAK